MTLHPFITVSLVWGKVSHPRWRMFTISLLYHVSSVTDKRHNLADLILLRCVRYQGQTMTTSKRILTQRLLKCKWFSFFTLKLYGSKTTQDIFFIKKIWVENDPRSIFHIKSMGRIRPTKYSVGVLCWSVGKTILQC